MLDYYGTCEQWQDMDLKGRILDTVSLGTLGIWIYKGLPAD